MWLFVIFLKLVSRMNFVISALMIETVCLLDGLLESQIPKYLVGEWPLFLTMALSRPIRTYCSDVGIEGLIIINSDFFPLMAMSLSAKNSLDISMILSRSRLFLPIQIVSSAYAKHAQRSSMELVLFEYIELRQVDDMV